MIALVGENREFSFNAVSRKWLWSSLSLEIYLMNKYFRMFREELLLEESIGLLSLAKLQSAGN
jgi:hypothetical protein